MGKPELLAPAGSAECFHAAVNAGADAVYLGLGDFNARLRAKNFTARDLAALIPHAHTRNVKVYATVNTLIKQSEIKPALDLLHQLDQIGIDAVIIADIGLMKLAAGNFPRLRIHGSTQAAVHNSYGAAFMQTLGAKRAVLARELSLEEIRQTVKRSPVEVEVFVHGALCCSISGMCLASSFIGGGSGNRGRCTQVCRRRFRRVDDRADGQTDEREYGYFFSPYDLQAITVIDKLTDYGVSSFKIEGRMKGAEYVSTAVKAYRRAIDFPDEMTRAARDLRFDFGRAKTMFFLGGRKGEAPIDPLRASGTGIFVGIITGCNDASSFTLSTETSDGLDISICKDDRLRVQPENGFEGTACRVVSCEDMGDKINVKVNADIKCNTGDYVFLIGRKDHIAGTTVLSRPCFNTKINVSTKTNIINNINNSVTSTTNKPLLWFKADCIGWLDILAASPCRRLIFDADVSETELLLNHPEMIRVWRSRVIVALPPFIEEARLDFWRTVVKKCMAVGIESFTISNAGHFPLVKGAKYIAADAPLWCLNRFTQKHLKSHGVNSFVLSYEDEYLNIRNICQPAGIAGIAPVYCKPPMFISRMPPAIESGTTVTDPHNNSFFVSTKNNLYYTLPNTPMCLFAKRKKLSECGIENFLIDVSFHEPDHNTLNRLIQGFRDGTRIDNGSIFNFKAGLR